MSADKLESLDAIKKMMRGITDEMIVQSAATQGFEDAQSGETLVGAVPQSAKKLFICAGEYSNLAKMGEMRQGLTGIRVREKIALKKQVRIYNQLAITCRELAWAEVLTILKPELPQLHIRSGWTLTASAEEDNQNPTAPGQEMLETLLSGLLPGEVKLSRTIDGHLVAMVPVNPVAEELERQEEERLKNMKPN